MDDINQQASMPEQDGIDIYDISGKQPVLGKISHDEVGQALASGKYSLPQGTQIPVISPDGEHGTIDATEAPQAFKNGYQYATPQMLKTASYETPGQQIKAGLEGLAQGVAGPLAPIIEKGLGVKEEDIRGRAEANPGTHTAGEAVGLLGGLATGFGEAALAEKAGIAGAKAIGLGEAVSTGSKIGSAATKGAIENMIIASGDEASKTILHDPEQSVQTAITDIGLSGLIGGSLSGAVGSVSPLWDATMGKKTGGILKAISNKLGGIEGVTPDAVEDALTKAGMSDVIAPEIKAAMASDPLIQQEAQILQDAATTSGVKYQEALVDFKNTVGDRMVQALGKSKDDIAALQDLDKHSIGESIKTNIKQNLEARYEPIAKDYEAISNKFKGVDLPMDIKGSMVDKIATLVGEGVSQESGEAKLVQRVLKEVPNLKNLEQLRNYTSALGRETSGIAKQELWEIGGKLRSALNDAEELTLNKVVAEQAPELLQKHMDTNAAYKALKNTVGELNDRLKVGPHAGVKTFLRAMDDLDNEAVLSRLNPMNKASIIQELQTKFPEVAGMVRDYHLSNILKNSSKFVKPGESINTNTLMKEINKLSPQMRAFVVPAEAEGKLTSLKTLLDSLPEKVGKSGTPQGLDGLLNRLPGTVTGMAAFLTGHNIVTAGIVGHLTKALGRDAPDAARLALLKFLGSNREVEPGAFKTMVDYMQSTIKGENLTATATKNVFKTGKMILPEAMLPTEKDRNRLDKQLEATRANPESLMNVGGKSAHYMPEHNQAMGQTTMQAVNYLNSKRPNTDKQGPLDSKTVVNSTQKSEYSRALDIAQQPLLVIDKIHKGTLTPQDVQAVQAMYPALYSKLSSQLVSNMTDEISKGHTIPYKTRIGLSMFLAQPLDSTMQPMAIISAQPRAPAGDLSASNQGSNPPSASSVKPLQKLPKSYQTPSQARESERAAGK